MIRKNVAGDDPQIDVTAFVDPSAIIIGKVSIGANSYIGPGVVIRADRFSSGDNITKIEIGTNCHIQDVAILHARAETCIVIEEETIVNHGAIVHGITRIGKRCFIGARSVVTNATIENSVYIRSNAIIENVTIPKESFIGHNTVIDSQEMTIPLRKITTKEKDFIQQCVNEHKESAMRYRYSLTD
jgi:carbonic anhydrase/acetyltransferase-like protein (isoleucine patch superfamily)